MFFREFTSSKRPRSSKQSARNRSCNFQTSTKIIHITYCHMMDRLGLFYSFCCCFFVRFQSPCSSVREFLEILRISTTDQKNPLEFDQHRFCFFAKTATFFPEIFFIIQMSQPGLKAGSFCSGRFSGRFFFWLHDSAPSLFQPLRCQCSEFFHQNITRKHHQNWNNKSSPKKPIQGLLDECLWKWWDVLLFLFNHRVRKGLKWCFVYNHMTSYDKSFLTTDVFWLFQLPDSTSLLGKLLFHHFHPIETWLASGLQVFSYSV